MSLGRTALRSVRLATTSSRAASSVAAGSSPAGQVSLPPLDNIEASWKHLSTGEQAALYQHLEQVQKKDWKELSVVEKKAAYYVSFGPHGPREPVLPPGAGFKIFSGTIGALFAAVGIFMGIRQFGSVSPTVTKEWEEATAEKAQEQKMNPFSGYASKETPEELASR